MTPVTPRSQRATLDAAGAASLEFGPAPVGSRWEIDRVSIETTAPAEARFYAGGRLIGSTFSAELDTGETGGRPDVVREGETFRAEVSAGTVGATTTVTVDGRQIRERA